MGDLPFFYGECFVYRNRGRPNIRSDKKIGCFWVLARCGYV